MTYLPVSIPANAAEINPDSVRSNGIFDAEDKPGVVIGSNLTDLWNGKRFARDYAQTARYCHTWGKWLVWDDKRWRIDDTGLATLLAKRTILKMYTSAHQQHLKLVADDAESKVELRKIRSTLDWAIKSQAHNRIKAMLDLAKSELPIRPDELDSHPMLLNVANGTLDLETGILRPHKQTDYLTKLCTVSFNPSATSVVFDRTVNGIFNHDKALIEYVKRFLGYCLTGDTREQVVPIAYGDGSNGKTILFKAIMETLGTDYADVAPPELLIEAKGDQHPTIKADLSGRRLVVAAETKQGGRLNEERLKALSGSDRVKARLMHQDFWTFSATHKLVVMTNRKPEVRGMDHGIWRRLALWPFTVKFWDADKGESGPPELKADKTLEMRLKGEHEGILAWLVAGCLEWNKHGMVMPAAVLAATREYQTEEDRVGAFLTECCKRRAEVRVKMKELYAAYCAWCKTNGDRSATRTAFTPALAKHEVVIDCGRRWYRGVELATEERT